MSATSPTLHRRLIAIGVCVGSIVLAIALAWWQWDRYSSTGGTMQNLGYVLQWPLFGLFPAFVFWRMRVLRRRWEHEGHGLPEPAIVSAGEAGAGRTRPVHEHPGPEQAEGPDEELAAYNRYLAELNARAQGGR